VNRGAAERIAVDVLYLLIAISILALAGVAAAFLWAVGAGQFDDLDGPAYRILDEDDDDRAQADPRESPSSVGSRIWLRR